MNVKAVLENCALTGAGNSTENFYSFISLKKSVFPPEILCAHGKTLGCFWGEETGAHVDQFLYVFL